LRAATTTFDSQRWLFMKLPLIRHWRWWIAAGAATLVIQGLKRKLSAKELARADGEKRTGIEAAQKTRAEEDLKAIFSLARRLGATRSLQTDVGRDDCLLRAAEVVLQSPTAAGLFVATYRDGFHRMCKAENARGGTSCQTCGGPLVERTAHDEVLNERMPIWTCMRCRAETPR
jgi:hypothetical protein